MRLFQRLFGIKNSTTKPVSGQPKKKGPLVHVFVFDSGPILQDEGKYITNIVKSLLPEAISKPKVPVTFFLDENIPSKIGKGESPNLKRAMNYDFAWMSIATKNLKLAEGIEPDKQTYTFTWEEYHSDWGNRGILYAFYRLISPRKSS